MPPDKDDHLPLRTTAAKSSRGKAISSSTTSAFTSTLSSLISNSSTNNTHSSSKQTKRNSKQDLFTRPSKRSKHDARSTSSTNKQDHTTNGSGLDAEDRARSQRKLQEKARKYNAMKRGDIHDEEGKYMVDYDRKFVQEYDANGEKVESSSEDEDEGEGGLVEYIDELGRTRQGTKRKAAKAARAKNSAAELRSDKWTARPNAPAQVIRGDTVQHQAFKPDAPVAEKMSMLAKNRDKSATPPPDEHFDGAKEVRTKGTGFFQFGEGDERKRQMEGLAKAREETELARKLRDEPRVTERKKREEDRKKKIEERNKVLAEKQGKKRTNELEQNKGQGKPSLYHVVFEMDPVERKRRADWIIEELFGTKDDTLGEQESWQRWQECFNCYIDHEMRLEWGDAKWEARNRRKSDD